MGEPKHDSIRSERTGLGAGERLATRHVDARHQRWIRVLGKSMAVALVAGCSVPDLKRDNTGQGATAGNAGAGSDKLGTNAGGVKSVSGGAASSQRNPNSGTNQGGATGVVSDGNLGGANAFTSGGAAVGGDPISPNGGVASVGGGMGSAIIATGGAGGNTGVQPPATGGSVGTTASGGGAGGSNSGSGATSAAGGTPITGGTRATGGAVATGGTKATGGTTSTGGSTSECVAGSVQNCTLGSLRGRRGCSAQGTFETCLPLISLGNSHGCLVTSSGNVKCWGDNDHGQCGQDPSTSESVQSPTKVTTSASGLTAEVISLSAGDDHTCAIVSVDAATTRTVCWGWNDAGRLGAATPAQSATPVVVKNLTDAVSVDAGGEYSCILTRSGQVKCWGRNNMGQMGNGASAWEAAIIPTVVPDEAGVMGMSVGRGTTCLVDSSRRVLCWGDNFYGSVGDNGTAPRDNAAPPLEACPMPCVTKPWPVLNLAADVSEVAGEQDTFCALRSSGKVHCWGKGDAQLLGRPPTSGVDAEFPTAVSGLEPAVHLAIGGLQACAIIQTGAVKCWGSNQYGGLGSDDPSPDTITDVPVQVSGLSNGVIRIVSGYGFVCAVNSSGKVSCWGRGVSVLGYDATQSRNTPTQLSFAP